MSRNKVAVENNLLALMRNHGVRNRGKTKKNEKKKKQKSQKNQMNHKEKMRLKSQTAEYDRVAKETAKRPLYKGNVADLEWVREPWDPRDEDEFRDYYLNPKDGRYYDITTMRLVGYTKPNGTIVPLKQIKFNQSLLRAAS